MSFRHLLAGLGALFLLAGGQGAHAQPKANSQNVGVCSPKAYANCIQPNADGSINVSGGGVITNYALETGGNLAAAKADLDSLVAALANLAGIYGANGTTIVSPSNAFNIQGGAASGSSDTDAPLNNGGRAATALPTAVTDGQKVAQMLTKDGKIVTVLNAPEALRVRGSASGTSGAITLIAAQGVVAAGPCAPAR